MLSARHGQHVQHHGSVQVKLKHLYSWKESKLSLSAFAKINSIPIETFRKWTKHEGLQDQYFSSESGCNYFDDNKEDKRHRLTKYNLKFETKVEFVL